MLFFSTFSSALWYFEDQIESVANMFQIYDLDQNFYSSIWMSGVWEFKTDFATQAMKDDRRMVWYFKQLETIFEQKSEDTEWLVWIQKRVWPIVESKLKIYNTDPQALSHNDKRIIVLAWYIYMRADIALSEYEYKDYKKYNESTLGISFLYPQAWLVWNDLEWFEEALVIVISPNGTSMNIVADETRIFENDGWTVASYATFAQEYLDAWEYYNHVETRALLIWGKSAMINIFETTDEFRVFQGYVPHEEKMLVITWWFVTEDELDMLHSILHTFEF